MASLKINDLELSLALDYDAMRSVQGAGSGTWVINAFPPYFQPVASVVPSVNYYQITNNYTLVDKMVNQYTSVNVNNSGANSNINAVLLTSLNS
jgi:hypothetical protein